MLLVATVLTRLFLFMQLAQPLTIKGELHVAPLGLPIVENPDALFSLQHSPSDQFILTHSLLFLLDFGVSIAILWTLLRKKW
jgi:hypothetical protein